MRDLIGKPWAWPPNPPETYDCWSLAVEVRKRMGLFTPDYEKPDSDDHTAHQRVLARPDMKVWEQLDEPRDGCLVGFGHRYVIHCGVYLKRRVLHASMQSSVVSHDMVSAQNAFGTASFWELRQCH